MFHRPRFPAGHAAGTQCAADAPGRWPASQAATTAATMAGQLAGYRWAKNRPPT
ncbi:hypothetical protein [Corynebacterium matruchotii]